MATMLSTKMRDVLIEHPDGAAVPIVKVHELRGLDASRGADRSVTTRALLARGFLKYNSNQAKAPTHTLITEAGRAELAALLGEYADALMRARFELPPAGDAAIPSRGQERRRHEAERFPVDIPAADAHLSGDYFTRSEGDA